jgi:predicted dehydrogenase/threonine dehydrogenase-like Zn-dependent dehydrogenase
MVLDKIRTDGLLSTIDAVRSKLSQPIPLGYSNVGIVLEVGKRVTKFKAGDRVLSNGAHAEIVTVPENLCALIPDSVSDETASFTVLSSIALQGLRLAHPTLGESFVVIGAGLIGLLTIQLLRAQGCRVLALDFDESKLLLAEKFGAEICNLTRGDDPLAIAEKFSRRRGVDGVLITASTSSSEPVRQAAQMCRKRGRIILVGVAGLELNRADFYEKELTFQVSCSYGPGRYDPAYEEQGMDYPIGFVRWTENRNFEAVLDMMASGAVDVSSLVSHRYPLVNAKAAYQALTDESGVLGIVLQYESAQVQVDKKVVALNVAALPGGTPGMPSIGFIGAGNYAARVLMPAFRRAGGSLHTVVSAKGLTAVIAGAKEKFIQASTDINAMLDDVNVNTVVIATRHDSHAKLAIQAIAAGKNVFVEKPLALTLDEINSIKEAYDARHNLGERPLLMVGFNRRFSPQVQKIKQLLASSSAPASFIFTVNAGHIPSDHWTQERQVGGGRIIGEACHFIDLMRYLAAADIVSVSVQRLGTGGHDTPDDTVSINMTFANGSFGSIHYFANGSTGFSKERMEIFVGQKILQLDNFRKLKGYGWPSFSKMNLWRQDKGQVECARRFLQAITDGSQAPIAPSEIFEVARVSVEVAQLLDSQRGP